MNVLGRYGDAVLETFLTQRVSGNVSLTDDLPSSSVTLRSFGISAVLLVLLVNKPLMFIAVSSVGRSRTPGITARALCFIWHTLSSSNKKGSRRVING